MNDHYRDTEEAEELPIQMHSDIISDEEGIVSFIADFTVDRDIDMKSEASDQDDQSIVESEPMALV
ncbi:hypothetical protein CCR75_001205 [Bremia lactucae]|uniref:Uncharacterized protein n=1 Tax=Bremia lactucae TaxID=4779 RepID=A0A976FQB9_BRELC|nr:hypothetical protein CCR75_001205 [Bremia lactucae]